MSAHITQVTAHIEGDPDSVYVGTDREFSWLVIGPVILHATQASPEVLEAIAQAALDLANIRRQQTALKAVAA
jgi:hypothetical protein